MHAPSITAPSITAPCATAPLVTIVVPCFNHAAYIEQCIDSILKQTYKPIELIVIDDGSSDDSAALIARLAAAHGFQFHTQPNQGLATTLNRALTLARGQYFCPMGSDDVMLPEKTRLQVEYMERHPEVAACGGNVQTIDSSGRLYGKRQKIDPARVVDFEALFTNRLPAIPAPTAMLRTDVLRELGGYDPAIKLEDFALWLKLTHSGHKIGALEEVLLQYRKHGSNTYKNLRLMYDSLLQTYAPYRDHPQYDAVLHQFLITTFLTAAKKGQAGLAREVLRKIAPRHYNLKMLRGLAYLAKAGLSRH